MKLTAAKSGFGALVQGRQIYVCAGNDGNNILKSFEAYDLASKKWNNLAQLNCKRDELAITWGPDNKIYAIGGFGGPNKYPPNNNSSLFLIIKLTPLVNA